MVRIISRLAFVAVGFALIHAACGAATPTEPASAFGPLAVPVVTNPVCGASSAWPRDPIRLAWLPVDNAASYTIEIDCLNCGNHLDPWVSQSGTPWQIKSGLQTPSYFLDVTNTVQREGGRAMRWRVWAVDRVDVGGPKSDWCVTTFSGSGLPTPGRTP